jgi:hypothetical protein
MAIQVELDEKMQCDEIEFEAVIEKALLSTMLLLK